MYQLKPALQTFSIVGDQQTESLEDIPVKLEKPKYSDAKMSTIIQEYNQKALPIQSGFFTATPQLNVLPFGRRKGRLTEEDLISDSRATIEIAGDFICDDLSAFYLDELSSAPILISAELPDLIDD
ncbi:MAG: hypothetical protein P4L53_14135 [Candidatus Obscuribacterales bacterium]|nr:hypothetical protein [Candidatus Obscuribacterales bacterium]